MVPLVTEALVFRPVRLALASATIFLLAAGCAGRQPHSSSAGGEVELGAEEVLVRVQNSYSNLVDVFAVSRGVVDRLGTVGIGAPQVFRVPLRQFPPDAQIQIVARPVGGNGTATSGPVSVRPGTVIDFSVSPSLTGSVLLR
jgi:hypothetical protein